MDKDPDRDFRIGLIIGMVSGMVTTSLGVIFGFYIISHLFHP
jgi:VIT1/CCC1 family predicted Fe2+/Mn2+ transporter